MACVDFLKTGKMFGMDLKTRTLSYETIEQFRIDYKFVSLIIFSCKMLGGINNLCFILHW